MGCCIVFLVLPIEYRVVGEPQETPLPVYYLEAEEVASVLVHAFYWQRE